VRPKGSFEVLECRVIEEELASDHRPVLVVLRSR
jgi:endonuclease/exonuclease/phosphatase (EEP) superfamily protein YafD